MKGLRAAVCASVSLGLSIGVPPAAFGQTETGLSPRQLLIRLTSAAGTGTGVSNIGEVIADLVGLEVSTAPLGSSAGGFTFTFDPVTRSFRRAAPSFGPMFGERAITVGEGGANVGINFLRRTYDTLDGTDIRGGGLETVTLSVDGAPLYRGTAALDVQTDTVVLFGNVALNGRLDAGVAIPYVRLEIDGRHQIADEVAVGAASAEGLGDVALRAKLRVWAHGQGGLALGVDARLPTGDKEALLGAGVTRALVSGIWSGTFGPLGPHASVGYEFWSDPFQIFDPLQRSAVDAGRNGIVYAGGMEWAATDRLTVNGEVTGRTVTDGGRLSHRTLPFLGNPFGITEATVASVDPRGLHQISASTGIKWNIAGTLLLTANVLVPLDDSGLRDRMTPIVGFDWGF
ncbi:MAG: transporter [Acidobacteria bacterium]|nr:transporter [Acidobacteriota bacterium]